MELFRIQLLLVVLLGGATVQDILIMIVEDEPLIVMELEQTLQEGGYKTTADATGEAAIERLKGTPNVRALVTDINLKQKLTGWDVARSARELFPNLPIVYVTSISGDEWTSQGVPNSVLIQKPFAPLRSSPRSPSC